MKINLQFINTDLFEQYCLQVDNNIEKHFQNLHDSELSLEAFSFYSAVAAVYSSKIEGENIELDSYIKHKRLGAHFLPDYTQKIDDLYDAYQFAQQNKLSTSTIEQAHALLTKHILQPARQGKIRKRNMFVVTKDGKIEYVATSPEKVQPELDKLYTDIDLLLNTELNFKEVLFFASMIHLIFVKIHPFEDGNGRTARLLEKWFIAEKLGAKAWFIQSEKNYYDNHQTYYNNIRALGLDYEELDYSKALPFLLMLRKAMEI